jgi:hypothetical protein
MFNKSGFFVISSISLIILSACNTRSINSFAPIQDSPAITAESNDKSKFGSAKNNLWIAESAARRWDISAALVKAEGSYVYEDGGSTWTYYFKSPFKQKAFRVDFTGFGQEIPNYFFGGEIRDWDWQVDSDRAIAIAKEQGLKNFPVIRMSLERRFANTEWELSTYDGTFRIDAQRNKFISKK